MQVLLTTDNYIRGSLELTALVESIVEGTLGRFGDRLTRVEVHVSDESSSAKSSGNDKRCTIEARLAGLQPIAVTNDASTVEQAVEGAAEKLERTMERKIDRKEDPKGRTSFAGE